MPDRSGQELLVPVAVGGVGPVDVRVIDLSMDMGMLMPLTGVTVRVLMAVMLVMGVLVAMDDALMGMAETSDIPVK
jgi:hypothetical protein